MVTVKAPATLVLAGEWAIREDGNSCLASAINKNVIVTIDSGESTVLHAPTFGIEQCKINVQEDTSSFENDHIYHSIKSVIATTLGYLQDNNITLKHVVLTINTENISITQKNGESQWIDFNLRASVGVALVKALMHFYDQGVTAEDEKLRIFKLVFLSLYSVRTGYEYGSDIAASACGATVVYQHVSFSWIKKQLMLYKHNLKAIIDKTWPGLQISVIPMPDDLKLCLCLVRRQKLTYELPDKIDTYKKTYPVRYKQLCASINIIVNDLIKAIECGDKETILELIKQNKQLLKHLLEESGNNFETPTLNTLVSCAEECGAAAKFAGTGENSYGFALCLDRFTAQKVKRKWEKKGMQMLNSQLLG